MKLYSLNQSEIQLYFPNISHLILEKSDLANSMLVPTCLFLASKFDEIDYNLPSFEFMKHSNKLKHFWGGLQWKDYVEYERVVLTLLDWNLDQMTPYHFLQSLIAQGILLSHEKVKIFQANINSSEKSENNSYSNYIFNCDLAHYSDDSAAIWWKKQKCKEAVGERICANLTYRRKSI